MGARAPLFLGDKGTKSNSKFASFLWPISVVHPLILAPRADPSNMYIQMLTKFFTFINHVEKSYFVFIKKLNLNWIRKMGGN